jgi:DNA-directed RNA polymerase beta subunit
MSSAATHLPPAACQKQVQVAGQRLDINIIQSCLLLQVRGLVKQQIDSFNYLIQEDLRQIVMASVNRILTCDADPDWYLQYLDVRVGSPTHRVNYVERRLTPHDCRLRDMTYPAPIMVCVRTSMSKFHPRGHGPRPELMACTACFCCRHESEHGSIRHVACLP